MIQLSSAGKHFGSKVLFKGLDWLLTSGDRVGVVGANGTGKSTLLKTLAGLEPLDDGSISAGKAITMGYLPQDGLSLSGRTVLEECLSVFESLFKMEEEMEALSHQMAELQPETGEYARAAERYHRLETEFQRRDGYSVESQAGAVLNGLGFSRRDQVRRTEEFSGGWQMRVALAKLLLIKPNLLLLDEPTNHLDLEARNWLEQHLRDYPYACVLVSHDRYFLDVTVTKILELWNRRAWLFIGNYDRYLAQKADRRAQLEAAWRNQQEHIHHLETFINRFRYQATKARQVQSRIKELEKIERIDLPPEEKALHFSFPQPPVSGRVVAEFRGVAKSYGATHVFAGFKFVVNRGDRVALVGINGVGKSTLIKLLAGTEAATAGECRLGHNVRVDYFAQDQYKALDAEARLIDDIAAVAPAALSGQTQLRSLLGCFLFSGDEVFKRIGVLSGGERNRYALARMLLRPPNFLLLDEPTNHLDLQAKDVLLAALQEFTGTVVFVSHDRYFIDKLATRIFEIEDGKLQDYPGNYEDYLWQKERAASDSPAGAISAGKTNPARESWRPVAPPRDPDDGRDRPRGHSREGGNPALLCTEGEVGPSLRGVDHEGQDSSYQTPTAQPRKVNPILIRRMEERRDELEEEIARYEAVIAAAEVDQAHFRSAEESIRLARLIEQRRAQLQTLIHEWEQLAVALEEIG